MIEQGLRVPCCPSQLGDGTTEQCLEAIAMPFQDRELIAGISDLLFEVAKAGPSSSHCAVPASIGLQKA